MLDFAPDPIANVDAESDHDKAVPNLSKEFKGQSGQVTGEADVAVHCAF